MMGEKNISDLGIDEVQFLHDRARVVYEAYIAKNPLESLGAARDTFWHLCIIAAFRTYEQKGGVWKVGE